MKFAQLAEYFERLEGTTRRLTMFDLLSELFQEADLEEIDRVVYLCQEQLLPPYRGLEIGMAEKLISQAIARAGAQEERAVTAQYKRLGDLGLVAEALLRKPADRRALEVVTVYEERLTIARTSGEGSVEQKIQLLADLLRRLSPQEARYVVRFAMGQLRLGIGDPTVLDAFFRCCGQGQELPARVGAGLQPLLRLRPRGQDAFCYRGKGDQGIHGEGR